MADISLLKTPYCEYSNCDAIVNEISDDHAFKGFDAKVVSFRLYNKTKSCVRGIILCVFNELNNLSLKKM